MAVVVNGSLLARPQRAAARARQRVCRNCPRSLRPLATTLCQPTRWQRDTSNSAIGAQQPNRLLKLPFRPAGREGLGESGGTKATQQRPSLKKCTYLKSSNPRLSPTQNQRMNIVRPLIGIHNLQIHQMPRHPILIRDAIATHHVPRQPRNIQ